MTRPCGQRCCTSLLYGVCKRPVPRSEPAAELGALGGTRTPNLLIRSQMLYPLSYERRCVASLRHLEPVLCQPPSSAASATATSCPALTIYCLLECGSAQAVSTVPA